MALRYVVNSAALRPVFNSSKRGVATRTARDVLASAPAPELSALKNGLKVVSENNGRQTATVGLYIESGSRYETDANNGVATFLEHLVYKGTGKRSQSQLESELASIGATLDSYTSRDRTAFIVESASSDVEKVVDILADVIRNSKLDSLAIEAERQVLLKQLDEADSNIRQVVFDNLHAAAFQGTPLARSPLGTTENISSRITAKELKEWVEDNYKPVRIVLSGVGGVQHSQLESLAQKYFGDLTNEYPRKTPQVSGIRFTGSEYRYRDDNIPYMYGAIAVEGVGFGHHDALPLAVASTAVGQWDRTHAASLNAPSRLVQKISLDHGVHLFENFNIHYKDAGLFGIYFILDGKDLTDSAGVVKAVQKEWKHLSSGVTLDEINAAKNQLRTQLYQKLETNRGKAENLAKQALYTEGVKSLADLEAAIDAIDHTSVREAVSRHVYDRDVAAAGVGRTEAWPNYAHVRYGMSWWRL